MKKVRMVFTAIVVAFVGVQSNAATWTDPQSGIVWKYWTNRDVAFVGSECGKCPAVPLNFTGDIEIPSFLGGCPVAGIGCCAFNNCSGLKSITIPNCVSNIDREAFSGCVGLKTISLPEGVTNLGTSAFSGCTNLLSITFPPSIRSIGLNAFRDCNKLSSLTLPFGLTIIGDSAFKNCSGLTSITLPSSVIRIGALAFSGCTGLTEALIPTGVTRVGYGAFSGCSKLLSVSIPSSVAFFEDNAFESCNELKTISVAEDNANYKSANSLLLSKDGRKLISGVNGEVEIPASVSVIGGSAFSGLKGLKTLAIPEGVERIGYGAFGGSGLVSINLPKSVTTIERMAFSACNSLKSINVDDQNSNFTSKNGLLLSKDGQTLVAGISGDVEIPKGVCNISEYAFYCCAGLERVSLPDSVTNIGVRAFAWCYNMKWFDVDSNNEWFKSDNGLLLTKDGSKLIAGINGNVAIPVSVRSVEDCAFSGRDVSTNVTISTNVTDIGCCAFDGCNSLLSVVIPSNVTQIAGYAFGECNRMTNVTIFSNAGCIGNDAFSACESLKNVEIFGDVEKIGSYAFGECNALETVKIHGNVKKLGDESFSSCRNLKTVEVFGDIINIGDHSFYDCAELVDVIIHDRALAIDDGAFEHCKNLRYFSFPQSVLTVGSECFKNCHSLEVINVSTNLEKIGSSCFYGCEQLIDCVVPSKVATLEYSTFSGCTNLKSCVIMKGVTTIEGDVWRNCSSLTNLLIPSSVQELGGAFGGCSNIVSISFAGNAPSISDYSFRRLSTTNINDIADEHSISSTSTTYYEDGSSVTWYYYYVRISGCLFNGTRDDLCVYVKPGSSGWIDGDVTGIPEEWPVESSNGRSISYDETIADPDWIEEYRYKVQIKFNRCNSGDEWLMPITRYWYIGDEIEIPDAMGQAKCGFSFRGWSDGVDAYRTGEKYTLKSGGVSFVPIWGATTFTLRYDGNGGVGTMTNEKYVVGAEVVLQTNAFTMAKREFLGWGEKSDGLVKYTNGQRTAAISPLLKDEVVLYAIWSEAKMEVGDYLDCPDFNFITGGPSPWTGVSDVTHSTVGAMRSGCVTNGESALSVTVSGEGKIDFWWKISSETYKAFQIDYASFRVDGVEQSWIGGEIDWQHIEFDVVGDGQHTISWAYVKDKDGSAGSDCAWLDEVTWTSASLIPDLGDAPTMEEITKVFNEAEDPNLAQKITNETEYVAFREWSGKVKPHGGSEPAGAAGVMAAPNAWLSYALGSETLIESVPTNGQMRIVSFEPNTNSTASAGRFDFTIRIDDIPVGDDAKTNNLAQIFGLEGGTSLESGGMSSTNVDITFGAPQDGKVKFTAGPRDANTKTFFMKVKMTP